MNGSFWSSVCGRESLGIFLRIFVMFENDKMCEIGLFLFPYPRPQFVFDGPGPQFLLTGRGVQFLFACFSFYS